MEKKDKIFIRGSARKGMYGTKVSIHRDALVHMKNDFLNFEIKEKRDGSGFYLELDQWEPKAPSGQVTFNNTGTTNRVVNTAADLPPGDDNSLPF